METDAAPKTALIAVMGPTGAGKTSYINLLSNSDLEIGHGMESCTSQVQAAKPFLLGDTWVTLIDTPGFDDTTRSETEILRDIALFLSVTYEKGQKLSGVIYMHRITDNRMGGMARRNFTIFHKLCGERNLKNVVIATTMWNKDKSSDGYRAEERREAQLKSSELFFKHALEKEAQMMRYEGEASALEIVQMLLKREPPGALRMQNELVEEKKPLVETDAGAEIYTYLQEMAERHKQEIEETKAQHEQEVTEARQRKVGAVEGHLEAIAATGWSRAELSDFILDMQQKLSRLEEQVRRLGENDMNMRPLAQETEQMLKDIAGNRDRALAKRKEVEKTARLKSPSGVPNGEVKRTEMIIVIGVGSHSSDPGLQDGPEREQSKADVVTAYHSVSKYTIRTPLTRTM